MPDPHRGPFSGPVSFERVAERVAAFDLGGAPEDEAEAEAARATFARLLLGEASPDAEGAAVRVGGVEGRIAAPEEEDANGAPKGPPRVVWFHGGGYAFGAPETHRRAATALASLAEEPVFLPRYRLAPAHRWPAPFEDGLAVARALQAAAPSAPLALVGDSAGGHLALTVALALALARLAFGDRDPHDPQVSPLLDDLSLLPPTLVEVGGREVLLGDGRLLAERGRAAGADVRLNVTADAFHMWQLWAPWLPAARASLGRAADFLKDRHTAS